MDEKKKVRRHDGTTIFAPFIFLANLKENFIFWRKFQDFFTFYKKFLDDRIMQKKIAVFIFVKKSGTKKKEKIELTLLSLCKRFNFEFED